MAAKVLVAVLDWGLGHASRSVPVIEALVASGVTVVVASSGLALIFLQRRFPNIRAEVLPSKSISYGKQGAGLSLMLRTISQPRLNTAQHKWIENLVAQEKITGIISDNVYGAWHADLPCAIITHQLNLKMPFAKVQANRILKRWLERFDEIWVPDTQGDGSISGSLSENEFEDSSVKRLGILSRFKSGAANCKTVPANKKYRFTALLSGPEPQRTMFEIEVEQLFAGLEGAKAIVQGLPQSAYEVPFEKSGVTTFPFADGDALAEILSASEVVICRSGYSSICDLIALDCKALLVPTPQQPEQIYLARHCARKGWFACANQGNITKSDLINAGKAKYDHPIESQLEVVILNFIERLQPMPS